MGARGLDQEARFSRSELDLERRGAAEEFAGDERPSDPGLFVVRNRKTKPAIAGVQLD
jgi:hypothetical protein